VAGRPAATSGPWTAGGPPATAAVAVDGKTLRGSGHRHAAPVHLLAAMEHTSHAVVGQVEVDHTTNEIARFRPLLERLDLADTVVAADALHTQREHADWLVTHKRADYLLLVKANQPTCTASSSSCRGARSPSPIPSATAATAASKVRQLQVTTIAGLDFPHATQALRMLGITGP
jgi:hypothetical protein